MKTKVELELDKAYESIGVKPRIYHFVYHFIDVYPFRAVTVATDNPEYTWNDIKEFIEDDIWESRIVSEYNRATHLLRKLEVSYNFHGVAICDRRDQFNRQRGRVIAKGRLLKYLRNEKFEK